MNSPIPDLIRCRTLLQTSVTKPPPRGGRIGDPARITARDIWQSARLHYSQYLPLLEGRYDALTLTRPQIAKLSRLLDRIECGMTRKVDGEWVETQEPTRLPAQIHTIRVLDSGRPVMRLGRPAQTQAQTLRNPFRKGLV